MGNTSSGLEYISSHFQTNYISKFYNNPFLGFFDHKISNFFF